MELPDVVFVPAYPDPRPGNGGVRFETRMLATGEVAGIAFRGRESLVSALGPAQPWMAVRLDLLGDLLGAAGVRRILLDPALDPELSGWNAERVEELYEVVEGNRG